MDHPYLCPACRENRTRFHLVYKLAQEVRKHPETGKVEFTDDHWEALRRGGGFDLDVQCGLCGHTAAEQRFIEAARRDAVAPPGRRTR